MSPVHDVASPLSNLEDIRAGAEEKMLDVQQLTARIGARTIVDQVSFDVIAGEVVAIIGPNGAGKTTLLESLVGLRPASGRVCAGGRALASFRDRAATFAFAPDEVTLPPEATVDTLIEHARRHRPRADAVFEKLEQDLGIRAWRGRSAGALSRGERKRVAIFLAFAADRPVVVLDEPFGAFDPLQLREVLDVVRYVAALGAALVVTVHQLVDAERIADRVLLLAAGRALAFGTIDTLRTGAGVPNGSLEDVFVALLTEGRRAP